MASTTLTLTQSLPQAPNNDPQIRVQFTTNLPYLQLPETTGPILVPTSFRRYGLSTLVNHLLGTDRPTPFDFLISGTFLRTSISDYLAQNGLSSESSLTLEYVRSIIPPVYLASFEHDDWVSSVDVLSNGPGNGSRGVEREGRVEGQTRILSGSYDGCIRVWNMSSEVLATSPLASSGGHASGVKAGKFLSRSQVVSSGLDRTVRIWDYSEAEEGSSDRLVPKLVLYGHRGSVDDISVDASSNRVLSASADHTVGVWSTKKSNAPPAPDSLLTSNPSNRSKRQKLATSDTPRRGSLALLKSHLGPVSSAIFKPTDPTVAYSSSWDHTLRTWDLPTGSLVDTRTTSHALLSLTVLPGLNLVATGTSARHITLIDPRASATTVAAMTLRGHANAVVSLCPDPDNDYGLVSGSHDSTCRVWDVRSTKPGRAQDAAGVPEGAVGESVYVIERESIKRQGRRVAGDGSKVFGVVWDREVGIVSAGEDRRVQINKGQGVLSRDGTGGRVEVAE